MSNNVYAVIMAGGKGERFWPQSRIRRPKQFLRLLGDATMIELTVDRLRTLLPMEHILVVTNREYAEAVREFCRSCQLKNLVRVVILPIFIILFKPQPPKS